jgi:hypothetical protein
MAALSAKSSNGRINWILHQGRLTEIGPSFPKFTMSAIDTSIWFGLLAAGSEDIVKYAKAEQGGIALQEMQEVDEDYSWQNAATHITTTFLQRVK